MKRETIHKMRAVKGLIIIILFITVPVYRLTTQGLTKENIMILVLSAAIILLVAVFAYIMIKGKQ
ncbi:MAG: hypothetical protein JW982_07890 [Spirochaetes bacterium]|nr:hypothetical protein [Spirochaetota bacterium]